MIKLKLIPADLESVHVVPPEIYTTIAVLQLISNKVRQIFAASAGAAIFNKELLLSNRSIR